MTRTISDPSYQPETFSEPHFPNSVEDYEPVASPTNNILEKIELLREKVYEARPVLANIMKTYGEKSLFEFSKSHSRTNFAFKNEARKKEFITIFRNEVARLLGEDVAKSAEVQINRYYTVSTAEHNSPLTHSKYLNLNLLSALPLLDPIDPILQNTFVLSCANISFDNYAFPRGLLITSDSTGTPITNQLAFFPRSVRACPVVYHPSYTKESIETAKSRINEWIREGSITNDDAEKLTAIVDEIYGTDDVLNTKYYTEQVTKTNYLLWKKIFDGSTTNTPNMVFLEQENIVNTLILSYHINKDTTIGKLLFDKHYHQLFLKHFDSISNAFNIDKKTGTILFWALPPGKKYREQLWYDNGYLVNEAGDYRLELSPITLKKALENHELIPSTTLSFIILSFYYGLRLRGAFEQTSYLTQMKSAYIEMLRELNDPQGIEDCINTPTTTLSFNQPILAFAKIPDGSLIPAGTLDLLLHGCEHNIYQVKEMAKKITLNEAVTRVLPLLYQRIYPEDERDPQLASVSESEIDKVLGIATKITPIAILSDSE